jgi:hypothetical protein
MNRVMSLISSTAIGALLTVVATASVVTAATSNRSPPPPPVHTTNVVWTERSSSRTRPGLKVVTLKPAPAKPAKSLPVQQSKKFLFFAD